ncbi:MAG: hypothetical protein B7X33_00020 [Lysobacterales bacterium 13-68-4]|jgi:ParB family chromosome partitioning protein|nr:MAG: hypothetical protein B7X33_00020 [Xanthomonadales bacterium 13-68-4]
MAARNTKDLMDRIGAAASRIAEAPDAKKASMGVGVPRDAGFVGKTLATSNKSLDAQLEEARRQAEEARHEASELKSKFASGDVAIKVDPKRVRPSPYADRHPRAFEDEEFLAFVDEIKSTGGNSEPGIVRPIAGDPDFDYELAAGHRRHRACLTAGLDFFCFVRELTDEQLVVSMVTENKGRKDLSHFEKGRHYALLLKEGKFPSMRKMAEALNEPFAVLQRLIAYGELPEIVISAFRDPRAIRSNWIKPLLDVCGRNAEAVAEEAKALRARDNLKPTDVYKRLTGINSSASIVATAGKALASVRMIHDRKAIVLYKDAPDELVEQLKKLIADYHGAHAGSPK